MPVVLVMGTTVTQNLPFSSLVVAVLIMPTHVRMATFGWIELICGRFFISFSVVIVFLFLHFANRTLHSHR